MAKNQSSLSTFIRLAKKRIDSQKDYLEFERFQGGLLCKYLSGHGIMIAGKRVLDVGCGFGGYSMALIEQGASVFGIDLEHYHTSEFTQRVIADANQIPFHTSSFDLVLCSSLIEHVPNPKHLLNEIIRVLNPQGVLYLSFPPFYSPKGGHQFSPFHYLGERIALKLFQTVKRRYLKIPWVRDRMVSEPKSYSDSFTNWGLYQMTIKKAEMLIKNTPLETMDLSTRWIPVNTAHIPILRELITWHVQFLLRNGKTA